MRYGSLSDHFTGTEARAHEQRAEPAFPGQCRGCEFSPCSWTGLPTWGCRPCLSSLRVSCSARCLARRD